MRMLEVYSSEKTYHPVVPDALCLTSLLEQILHYMVQKGNINVQALFSSLSCLPGGVLGTVSTR